ncbi:glycosyltransferase family 61 protein [Thioclava sp. GXIMD4215]|uniref:glycosyltransferase family 61 protein n=1 Tax=Thioclava sp. GXIMD4215 TaxID=3131928 RepID=UPI00324F4097
MIKVTRIHWECVFQAHPNDWCTKENLLAGLTMSVRIELDRKVDRAVCVHDFDASPSDSVAVQIFRHSQDVPMKALAVHDPDKKIGDEQRSELGATSRHYPEVAVVRLRNACVSGEGLVLTEEGKLLPESNLRPPHIMSVNEDFAELRASPCAPIKVLSDGPVVALNGVWPVHYGHWTYDNFARLGLAQQLLGFRPYSVLTGYKHRANQWCKPGSTQATMLGLAGVGMGQIHRIADHEWIKVRDLVVVAPLNNFRPPVSTIFAQKEMFDFLETIATKVSGTGKGKRIYCSRRDTPNRILENESELIAELAARFGFVEVMLGEHSVEDQISIFRDAEIAVGPIGNAFMNMPYMDVSAKLLVLLPSETWHFLPYYQTFATAAGYDVHALIGTTVSASGDDLNRLRWKVDVQSVLQYLEAKLI